MKPSIFLFPLLFALFFWSFNPLLAQGGKKTVGVAPFSFSKGKISESDADLIYQDVSSAITTLGRFNVVRRDQWNYLVQERELQKNEAFIDGKTVQQGASLGAEVLFVGHVLDNSSEGRLGTPNPVIHLSAVDVATGAVLASEVISRTERRTVPASEVSGVVTESLWNVYYVTGYWQSLAKPLAFAGRAGKAFEVVNVAKELSASLDKQVQKFVDDHFPPRLTITEFIADGDKIAKIVVFGNESSGLKKGSTFEILEEKETVNPDGTRGKRVTEVARAKVVAFEGDYTVLKITDGGTELASKQTSKNIYLTDKK